MIRHQWMFVTDTTDAGYPPEDSEPEALLDRLSEVLTEHSHGTQQDSDMPDEEECPSRLRKPRLAGMRNLTSLRQLRSFFARASIDTFEGVYEGWSVDWKAVEEGFESEIFEA
jgi:hypothetical protein